MSDSFIKDKIVWITGSGRGIGAATAIRLAALGARVVVSARTEKEINAVAERIGQNNGRALAIPCDVTVAAQIRALVNKIKSDWGAIDILINNAGISTFKKIILTSEEEWDGMMQTNLKSAFLCCQAVLPDMMERQSGHIVNIVSVAGKQPFYNSGAYCASKYGLHGFTEVLRLEMRKYHIRVTAVCPGAVDTSIWGSANVDRTRMMKPEQIAKIIAEVCDNPPELTQEEVVVRPIGGDL
jgi:NAD(P)-dependent dehydrogenase (short-subunit alcohol dehydrogenase family)